MDGPDIVTKAIDLPDNWISFEANGHTYERHTSLPYNRWRQYQKLQVAFGLGKDLKDIADGLGEAFQHCEKGKLASASVTIRDLQRGVLYINEPSRVPVMFQLVALFINRKGEDLRNITDAMVREKVHDWNEAGISAGSFFRFAIRSIPGFLDVYMELSRDTSAPEQTPTSERVASGDAPVEVELPDQPEEQ